MKTFNMLSAAILAVAITPDVGRSDAPINSGTPTIGIRIENSARKCSGPITGVIEQTDKKGRSVREELRVVATPQNFAGKVNLSYHYTTDGLDIPPSNFGREFMSIEENTSNTAITFKFPPLRGDRLTAQVLLVVTGTDKNGTVARGTLPFVISREVTVKKDETLENACTQVYSPEVDSGVYDNQNDTDMTVSTSTGVTKVTEERKSKTLGWSFAPSIFSGGVGVSLFGINGGRLSGIAKQVSETSYTTVTQVLNPGDIGFRYTQITRIKEPYKVFVADGCGKFNEIKDGRIYLDREVIVNNFYKLASPYDSKALSEVLKTKAFGRPVINTCGQLDALTIPFAQ